MMSLFQIAVVRCIINIYFIYSWEKKLHYLALPCLALPCLALPCLAAPNLGSSMRIRYSYEQSCFEVPQL